MKKPFHFLCSFFKRKTIPLEVMTSEEKDLRLGLDPKKIAELRDGHWMKMGPERIKGEEKFPFKNFLNIEELWKELIRLSYKAKSKKDLEAIIEKQIGKVELVETDYAIGFFFDEGIEIVFHI